MFDPALLQAYEAWFAKPTSRPAASGLVGAGRVPGLPDLPPPHFPHLADPAAFAGELRALL